MNDKTKTVQNILDLGKLKGLYGKNGEKFCNQINEKFFLDKEESEQPSKIDMSFHWDMIDGKYKEKLTAKLTFDDGRVVNLEYGIGVWRWS